jgi:hypothetical protein
LLVRHDPFWNEAPAFYQFDQKSLCRANVSPRLKDVLNKKAVLDDGPPVPVRPARDFPDDFVQVLDVAGMRLPSPPNVGDHRAELDGPAPDRVVRNVHATFQHQLFNRAQAQIEPGIEPDTMSNVRTHCDDESDLA